MSSRIQNTRSLITRLTFMFYLVISLNANGTPLQKDPNIIFILTDDQRWDALGHTGNEIIQTPNMDQLAREGVYFRNAFVTDSSGQ